MFSILICKPLILKGLRLTGVEPVCLAALPPQSSVSANSTISATRVISNHSHVKKQDVFMDFGVTLKFGIANGFRTRQVSLLVRDVA